MAAQESLLTLVDFGNAFLSNRRTEAAGGSNSGLSFFCWGAGGLLFVGGAVGLFVVGSICWEVMFCCRLLSLWPVNRAVLVAGSQSAVLCSQFSACVVLRGLVGTWANCTSCFFVWYS